MTFKDTAGTANPFHGINVDGVFRHSTFADIRGNDGVVEFVAGGYTGKLFYFENNVSAATPSFIARTESDNPFNDIDVGDDSAPILVDLGWRCRHGFTSRCIRRNSVLFRKYWFSNSPNFTARSGTANPFDGIDVGSNVPTFLDVNGDVG